MASVGLKAGRLLTTKIDYQEGGSQHEDDTLPKLVPTDIARFLDIEHGGSMVFFRFGSAILTQEGRRAIGILCAFVRESSRCS